MLPRRNILIFHLGALGDFVLTWPLALAMGRLYPQSRVFYVTHGSKGQLVEQALRLEAADIEGGWHALFGENGSLPPPAEKLLSAAHTIVSFLTDGQDVWAKNVARIAPGATLVPLIPPTLAAPPTGEHAAAFIESQLQSWPVIGTAVSQILRSISERGIGGCGPGDGTIVIHPGSGAAFKCWPIERFVELARRLTLEGRRVRFVIGAVEAERWPASEIDRLAAMGQVERPTTLLALWKIISAASLFIGNDSGPAHLAGIACVPTVVIYGPTSPEIWKPLGPKVMTVQEERLENISVDAVCEAIRRLT